MAPTATERANAASAIIGGLYGFILLMVVSPGPSRLAAGNPVYLRPGADDGQRKAGAARRQTLGHHDLSLSAADMMPTMQGFLISAVVISLSGVMAPGPMTTATIAAGTRRRHAGAGLAVGHAIVEFPLMLLILGGMGRLLELPHVQTVLAVAGGAVLLVLGAQLLIRSGVRPGSVGGGRKEQTGRARMAGGLVVTGIVLTAANPYFLLWWATVGLALATKAWSFGVAVFIAFAILHWLCDLLWLEVLSAVTYSGSRSMGGNVERIITLVCGVVLLGFGGKFLYDAWTLP